jgi:molybdopterin/thiamine biosynthesis adenylyltransferase
MISGLKTIIDIRAYEKLRKLLEEPPEVCGSMKVRYLQCGCYFVLDFERKEYSRSGGHCEPRSTLGWFGIWHTHPLGFAGASSIDIGAIRADLEAASKGDLPGIPPVHLIAAKVGHGIRCSVYFPTYKVRYASKKLAEGIEPHRHTSGALSFNPLLRDLLGDSDQRVLQMFNFSAMNIQEREGSCGEFPPLHFAKIYGIEEFLPLTRDNARASDGVFIGASTPPHFVPVILRFFAENSGRKRFLVYLEDFRQGNDLTHGLYEVEVEGFEPHYVSSAVEVEGSKSWHKFGVGVLDTGFGIENRVKRLRDEHGIDLIGLRGRRIALFGVGFLGTRLLARLSKMFDEVTVVDYDIVGEENVSYQELFAVEDVGMPKALAASRRALQSAPLSRIYVVNYKIPLYPLPLSGLVESIVGWSDVVVTTFDSFLPRLTVQLACNKLSKPLIDVGVGPQDAEVRAWYRRDKACIACYTTGFEELPSREIYASDPRIAELASDIVAVYVERILSGRDVPSLTKVDLNLKVETRDYPRDEGCAVCASEVQTQLGSFKPWDKIGKTVELRRGGSIKVLREDVSASWLKYWERLGYKLA